MVSSSLDGRAFSGVVLEEASSALIDSAEAHIRRANRHIHGSSSLHTLASSEHGSSSDRYALVPQNHRPFRCDQCSQEFNRNHDLKRHQRIHLAVKPFPCGNCDKSFSREDALKRHVLVKSCGKAGRTAKLKENDSNYSPESGLSDLPGENGQLSNTLWVGNLQPSASEAELTEIFSKRAGYRRLCFCTEQNGTSCLVQFETVEDAKSVLRELDGYYLRSSTNFGIILGFSKKPLGTSSAESRQSAGSHWLGTSQEGDIRDMNPSDHVVRPSGNPMAMAAPAPSNSGSHTLEHGYFQATLRLATQLWRTLQNLYSPKQAPTKQSTAILTNSTIKFRCICGLPEDSGPVFSCFSCGCKQHSDCYNLDAPHDALPIRCVFCNPCQSLTLAATGLIDGSVQAQRLAHTLRIWCEDLESAGTKHITSRPYTWSMALRFITRLVNLLLHGPYGKHMRLDWKNRMQFHQYAAIQLQKVCASRPRDRATESSEDESDVEDDEADCTPAEFLEEAASIVECLVELSPSLHNVVTTGDNSRESDIEHSHGLAVEQQRPLLTDFGQFSPPHNPEQAHIAPVASKHSRSSSSSMREALTAGGQPQQSDIWAYVQNLEGRFSRMQDEYELRIARMQKEVVTLKSQFSKDPSALAAPLQNASGTCAPVVPRRANFGHPLHYERTRRPFDPQSASYIKPTAAYPTPESVSYPTPDSVTYASPASVPM